MRSSSVLLALVLFASCGEPALLQSPDGRWRLLDAVDTGAADAAARTTAMLAKAPADTVLVAFDATSLPPRASRGERRAMLVGTSGEARVGDAEVVIAGLSGGDVAVELAVLHCHGIDVPKALPLGARVTTANDRAAGGTQRPGPGEVMLQLLRMRHKELLSGGVATDAVCRIGFVAIGATDDAMDAAATTARRFRHVELVVERVADAADLPKHADALLDGGCRAVIVATPAPLQLGELRTRAEARRALLIALDPTLQTEADCVLGADPEQLGRTAADAARALLGDGGALLELHDASHAPTSERVRHAFHQALGLTPR